MLAPSACPSVIYLHHSGILGISNVLVPVLQGVLIGSVPFIRTSQLWAGD